MNTSESINEIATALAKAQAKIEGAIKGHINPAFRSKYADLGAVWDAIREPLSANGIAVLQQLTTDENGISCTTLLTHASGQWIKFDPLTVPLAKRDGHGVGSAATYCRRYSLQAAVGIAPVDDDGNAAVGHGPANNGHDERDVAAPRRKVVRAAADACIAAHGKGDGWGCYEQAAAITDPEEKLLLWDYLHSHSKVRAMIKEYAELEKAGGKAA